MTELGAVLLVIGVLALMVGVIWLIYVTRDFRLQCPKIYGNVMIRIIIKVIPPTEIKRHKKRVAVLPLRLSVLHKQV